jgi:hypothetical protein
MAYIEPKATILDVRSAGAITTVVVEFDRMPSEPIAPAALYVDPRSGNEQFQLHKLVRASGLKLEFQTFASTHAPPAVGETFSFRSWWVKDAMDAALDIGAKWTRRAYPDDGSHVHCLFTWESIEANSDHPEGYHSDEHGWISVRAYEDFIRDDIYRVRRDV